MISCSGSTNAGLRVHDPAAFPPGVTSPAGSTESLISIVNLMKIQCSQCGQVMEAGPEMANQQAACPQCGTEFVVLAPSQHVIAPSSERPGTGRPRNAPAGGRTSTASRNSKQAPLPGKRKGHSGNRVGFFVALRDTGVPAVTH